MYKTIKNGKNYINKILIAFQKGGTYETKPNEKYGSYKEFTIQHSR